jgi:hypothetical protein
MHAINRRRDGLAVTGVALTAAVAVGGPSVALAHNSTAQDGVTTTDLAVASPENAPGQELHLLEVRIPPRAKLGPHFHLGTRTFSIRSGVLTFTIVSGTVNVTRANATTEQVSEPATLRLRPGDAISETPTLIQTGTNNGKTPVVVLVAQLLTQGAPLTTPASAPSR